jgi:hypothetical protein
VLQGTVSAKEGMKQLLAAGRSDERVKV